MLETQSESRLCAYPGLRQRFVQLLEVARCDVLSGQFRTHRFMRTLEKQHRREDCVDCDTAG